MTEKPQVSEKPPRVSIKSINAGRVANEIRSVYAEWHGCALSPSAAKRMKLRPGRLCDVCEDMAASRITRLLVEEDTGE